MTDLTDTFTRKGCGDRDRDIQGQHKNGGTKSIEFRLRSYAKLGSKASFAVETASSSRLRQGSRKVVKIF